MCYYTFWYAKSFNIFSHIWSLSNLSTVDIIVQVRLFIPCGITLADPGCQTIPGRNACNLAGSYCTKSRFQNPTISATTLFGLWHDVTTRFNFLTNQERKSTNRSLFTFQLVSDNRNVFRLGNEHSYD